MPELTATLIGRCPHVSPGGVPPEVACISCVRDWAGAFIGLVGVVLNEELDRTTRKRVWKRLGEEGLVKISELEKKKKGVN